MIGTPAWRLDDAAAYDAMRDDTAAAAARLALQGELAAAAEIWAAGRGVDGFSRESLDELVAGLHRRFPDDGERS